MSTKIKINERAMHVIHGEVTITNITDDCYYYTTDSGTSLTCPHEAITRRAVTTRLPPPIPVNALPLPIESTQDILGRLVLAHAVPAPPPVPARALSMPIESTQDILRLVLAERAFQDRKWGILKHRAWQLNPDKMMTVLGEEFGEVCQAFLSQKPTDAEDPRHELIQVAAVCVATIQTGDLCHWWDTSSIGDTIMDVLLRVSLEREQQDKKFGPAREDPCDKWKMIAVLGEEFGEACQAFLSDSPTDKEDPRYELIQTAAVAVKMIEMGDAQGWW